MKRGPPLPVQYIVFGKVDLEDQAGQRFGQDVAGAAAGDLLDEDVIFALGRGSRRPALRARCPACGRTRRRLAAGADLAGPCTFSSLSGWRSGKPVGAQHQRRGVASSVTDSCGDFELLEQQAQIFQRPGIIQSGISSVPISSRNGRLTAPPPPRRLPAADRPRPARRRPPVCAPAGSRRRAR